MRDETYLGVVDEGTTFAVGWEFACGGVLETLDDSGLARAIVPDDECQRCVEAETFTIHRVEGSDALDGQAVDTRHALGLAMLLGAAGGVLRENGDGRGRQSWVRSC